MNPPLQRLDDKSFIEELEQDDHKLEDSQQPKPSQFWHLQQYKISENQVYTYSTPMQSQNYDNTPKLLKIQLQQSHNVHIMYQHAKI